MYVEHADVPCACRRAICMQTCHVFLLVTDTEVMWACLLWRPLIMYLTLTGVVGTTIGRTKKARQLKIHWNRQDDSRTKTKKDIHQPMDSYDTL